MFLYLIKIIFDGIFALDPVNILNQSFNAGYDLKGAKIAKLSHLVIL